MKPTFKNISHVVLFTLLAFFCWLMLKIVLLYTPLRTDIAFLRLKQQYIHIDIWRISFFVHVFCSLFALMAGFTQFSKKLRREKPLLHRRLGYVYVINILCITGPAGLIISFYANGGILSRVAFVTLSVLWISFTAMALYKAVKKNFVSHKAFMVRSYALTLSALTLRLWKVLLDEFSDIRPINRYRIIAWLGWVLNLLIAEIIICRSIEKKRSISFANKKTATSTTLPADELYK